MAFHSKLPQLETSIFTVMSGLANEHGAINLSQGFPNFDCDPKLKTLVTNYIERGFNQYAPMGGVPVLQQRIADKIQALYGSQYQPAREITITAGATQAIYGIITAFIHPGEEVIIFEPAYDSYQPNIELAGGIAVPYPMQAPDWRIDWQAVRALVTERTRMILINSPHNPTGSMLEQADMEELAKIAKEYDLLILSDEVYEHLTFDGRRHQSILGYESLRERALAVFSFGKTLHATGWKLGYVVADERLMWEFRKVHQFNVFSVSTPMQYAIADYLEDSAVYTQLPDFFQAKRDAFAAGLADSGFRCLPSAGTYFMLADYSGVSELPDVEFAKWLIRTHGVATIPISVFYRNRLDNKLVRFCFAKTDATLAQALERLQRIPKPTH